MLAHLVAPTDTMKATSVQRSACASKDLSILNSESQTEKGTHMDFSMRGETHSNSPTTVEARKTGKKRKRARVWANSEAAC